MRPGLVVSSIIVACVLLIGVVALRARQTASPQCFVFDNIRERQTLSGDVSILARDLTGLDMVELWLDGRRYSSGTDRQSGSNFYVNFGVPTGVYADGPHTLELRLGPRVFDRRRVYFRNARHPAHGPAAHAR